jgi:tRNA threonylcarbamoyladenosine biosynthesis protein TsaB
MLILALDTSSPLGSLALLRDATLLAQRVTSSQDLYSAGLLRDTKELLDSARISLSGIDLFAVDAGPGSFTGLRVGLTTVKAWAEVWRRPVAAVSGLEAMAVFRGLEGDSGGLDRIGDEILATADEFLQFLQAQLGDGLGLAIACISPDVIVPALERQGLGNCRIEVVSGVLAPSIGQLGYAKAIRGDVVDALHLDANYIRRSDAEMNWRSG